jgi:hypothetical protein
MKHSEEFSKEFRALMATCEEAISNVLLSESRISKHQPWTWQDEPKIGHLLKAARHIMTHVLITNGQQEPTGDNHLDNAMCRLVMAMTRKGS